MGAIISAYVFPHPPIIIPEVGKGEELTAAKTIEAVERAAGLIALEKPSTIIITTPHGPVFQDYIHISDSKSLAGDLGRFGCHQVGFKIENNTELAYEISLEAKENGIFAGGIDDLLAKKYKVSRDLDHGALIPLYFVLKHYRNFRLVHISISGLSLEEHYNFGMCIARAVEKLDERVVFLASGDLSHRLSHSAPYGYDRRGREFDGLFIDSVKNLKVEQLLELEEGFCEGAGECGLRSFLMMFGALDGRELSPEVYSYEGPYGVGYCVARIGIGGENEVRKVLKNLEEKHLKKIDELRRNEDPYVALARKTLEAYVLERQTIGVPVGLLHEMLEQKAGVFVSIKKQGQLRGCIGTIGPTRNSIAEEIIQNAVSAGMKDPRFDPVTPEELDKLVYSVDVLKAAQHIGSISELDVVRYGVIVHSGRRSGLLLPNLEGVETPEQQVSIALQKAGIRPEEKYTMERFEVIRHK